MVGLRHDFRRVMGDGDIFAGIRSWLDRQDYSSLTVIGEFTSRLRRRPYAHRVVRLKAIYFAF